MSGLTFQGDAISNFGTYLPAPYIERIELQDDSVITYISIFITSTGDDTLDDEIVSKINNDLNVYCLHAAVWAAAQTSNMFGFEEEDWQSVINGNKNIFSAYYEYRTQAAAIAAGDVDAEEVETFFGLLEGLVGLYNTRYNILTLDMNASTSVWTRQEDLFTESGQKIIKFRTSIEYKIGDDVDGATTDGAFSTAYTWDFMDNEPSFWHTFAFASLYEYSDDDIADVVNNKILLDKITSDVTYEKVFSNGELKNVITSYVDSQEIVYDQIPIQSISGQYYKADNISHDEIVEYFEDFVTKFKEADVHDESDTDLNDMLDQISTMVQTYGNTAKIIRRLDDLRSLFPSKSSATSVGKLYVRFRKRVISANRAVESGTPLKNILHRNPKILDLRGAEITDLAASTFDDEWRSKLDEYIYPGQSFISRNAIYSSTEDNEQAVEDLSQLTTVQEGLEDVYADLLDDLFSSYDTDALVRNRGFFFFDYEKAFRTVALINRFFSVAKLSKFGINITPYSSFRFSEASITRTENDGDIVISCDFDEDVEYPLSKTTTFSNQTNSGLDVYGIASPGYYSDASAEIQKYSENLLISQETDYLTIRNFVPRQTGSISSEIPDYRLACFSFQDFYDDDIAYYSDSTGYTVNITIEDRTIEVASALMDHFGSAKDKLDEFVGVVTSDFSYNPTTGDYNEFFNKGITNYYSGNLQEAPWIMAPVIYCIHQDLVYDLYDGDTEKILEAAQTIIDSIAPYSGNYEALFSFNEAFQSFNTAIYHADTGTIGRAVSALVGTTQSKTFQSTISYSSAGSHGDSGDIYGVLYVSYAGDVGVGHVGVGEEVSEEDSLGKCSEVMPGWAEEVAIIEGLTDDEDLRKEMLQGIIDVYYSYPDTCYNDYGESTEDLDREDADDDTEGGMFESMKMF